jgi:hypothetical protein
MAANLWEVPEKLTGHVLHFFGKEAHVRCQKQT